MGQKIIINACYGGFGLSQEAFEWLIKHRNWKVTEYTDDGNGYKDPDAQLVLIKSGPNKDKSYVDIFNDKYFLVNDNDDKEIRTSQDIIDCINELGQKASGQCSKLNVIEIPDGVNWQIEEYDGNEWISEKHETWS